MPLAIGISILRYHLWDVDLIINRTLVYVPLTAIIAGVYTASISLSQRLFVAITGEKSDAAIVLTTLLVASTFTPIKNGLQSLVDKRFKQAPDPTEHLRVFGEQLQTVIQIMDVEELTERALQEAVTAFHATSGALYIEKDDKLQLAHTRGEWCEEAAEISVPLESDGNAVGLIKLGPRSKGLHYGDEDRQALQQSMGRVARAMVLARRIQ
jgi:hypothetical protein